MFNMLFVLLLMSFKNEMKDPETEVNKVENHKDHDHESVHDMVVDQCPMKCERDTTYKESGKLS